jgi:hypothetical protein
LAGVSPNKPYQWQYLRVERLRFRTNCLSPPFTTTMDTTLSVLKVTLLFISHLHFSLFFFFIKNHDKSLHKPSNFISIISFYLLLQYFHTLFLVSILLGGFSKKFSFFFWGFSLLGIFLFNVQWKSCYFGPMMMWFYKFWVFECYDIVQCWYVYNLFSGLLRVFEFSTLSERGYWENYWEKGLPGSYGYW